jgi:hypothetical protein
MATEKVTASRSGLLKLVWKIRTRLMIRADKRKTQTRNGWPWHIWGRE